MSDKYYVISSSEDGDIAVIKYTKSELLKMIEEYEDCPPDIINKLDDSNDNPMYWGNSMLIIKGEIVCPKAVDVIKRWDIE